MRYVVLSILLLRSIPGPQIMAQELVGHAQTPPPRSASHAMISPNQWVFPPGQQTVEVRFRLDHSKIVVPVRVNGSDPLDFVLDTGANLAFLFDGGRMQGSAFDIVGEARLQGAGHGAEINMVRIAGNITFALGGVELRGNQMALGTGGTGVVAGTSWDGIFGRQVFENLVVEIDWDSEVLLLHETESYQVPDGASVLPLVFERGHAFVQADVAIGGGSPVAVQLVIDTGANHALALATDGGRLRLPPRRLEDALLGRGLSGEIRGALGRIDSIRLGDFVLEDVVTSFPAAGLISVITSQSDGNLGSEILRRFTTTFDYPRQRMILVANDHLADAFEFSTAGFRTHHNMADGNSAEVDDVYPDSPAARAGIAVGDRILAIDGRAVRDLGTEQLGKILRRRPGTELRVKLARGEEIHELILRLETVL